MSAVVLLIDDDRRIRNSLGRLLRVLSYQVVEAADWDAALVLAAAQRPDVVVTDLHMPEHSGVDIARRLRSHPELGGIPIIALTATPPLVRAEVRSGNHVDESADAGLAMSV